MGLLYAGKDLFMSIFASIGYSLEVEDKGGRVRCLDVQLVLCPDVQIFRHFDFHMPLCPADFIKRSSFAHSKCSD